MFVVVCYDVPDDRRRARISKRLQGFGVRVQKTRTTVRAANRQAARSWQSEATPTRGRGGQGRP